ELGPDISPGVAAGCHHRQTVFAHFLDRAFQVLDPTDRAAGSGRARRDAAGLLLEPFALAGQLLDVALQEADLFLGLLPLDLELDRLIPQADHLRVDLGDLLV